MTVQNCCRLAFEVGVMSVFVLIVCFHRFFNLLLFISVRDSINLVSSRKDRHCFALTKLSNVLHCLLAHLRVSIEFIEIFAHDRVISTTLSFEYIYTVSTATG